MKQIGMIPVWTPVFRWSSDKLEKLRVVFAGFFAIFAIFRTRSAKGACDKTARVRGLAMQHGMLCCKGNYAAKAQHPSANAAPRLAFARTIISKLSQSPTISPARIPRVSLILEPRNPRTSELLAAIASAEGEERIYFGDLTAAFRFDVDKATPPRLPDTVNTLSRVRYEIAHLPKPALPGADQKPPSQEEGERKRV